MARIGIDIDGVLCDFNQGFVKIINQLYPNRVSPDYVQQSWDWHEVLSPSEYDRCFQKAMSIINWWLTLPAYYKSVIQLNYWLSGVKDQEVWIITSRPDSANEASMSATYQSKQWLEFCNIGSKYNTVELLTVPHSEDKVDICSRLDIDWMIDDKPETIQAMDDFPYLHAALMDQPWNQGVSVKWRVKSMKEFLKQLPG